MTASSPVSELEVSRINSVDHYNNNVFSHKKMSLQSKMFSDKSDTRKSEGKISRNRERSESIVPRLSVVAHKTLKSDFNTSIEPRQKLSSIQHLGAMRGRA